MCGTLVRVSNAELRQRAEALGVQVIFWDWQGRETTVPDETLEAIVAVLTSLAENHPDCFDRVMSGCRAVSNSGREIDGLDDLLDTSVQAMFDVAFDREQRRETSGFVPPAEARAFLEASRRIRFERDIVPPMDPIARAHLRTTAAGVPAPASPALDDSATESLAAVVEVLVEAGIHHVHVEGSLAKLADWEWTYILKPRQVKIEAPEWNVSGVKPGGVRRCGVPCRSVSRNSSMACGF